MKITLTFGPRATKLSGSPHDIQTLLELAEKGARQGVWETPNGEPLNASYCEQQAVATNLLDELEYATLDYYQGRGM